MILGIDEVGRGAWAGPVVVGAVAVEPQAVLGLNDSKLLSKKKRIIFAALIRQRAAWIGIGWVSARKVDEIGMSAALKLAAQHATEKMPSIVDEVIIDGTIRLVDAPNVTTLKKADQLIPAVSAASIIAKVARDRYMQALHEMFPEYGFTSHVGYGTAAHQAALDAYGPSRVHRMSFAPMSSVKAAAIPKETTVGNKAEAVAASYLERNGYCIVERNWKTKRCEIDIIAERSGEVFFVEVKYRKNAYAGDGFSYITAAKQRQMAFAAESWCVHTKWRGSMRLAAIQLTGDGFEVTGFTTEIFSGPARRARTRQFGS